MLKGVALHDLGAPTEEILAKIRKSDVLHIDETSISLSGRNVWIWTFLDPINHNVSCAIRPSRGADVLEEIVPGWNGTAVTDGWKAYGRLVARRCWAHLVREAGDADRRHGTAATRHMAEELEAIRRDAVAISEHRDAGCRKRQVPCLKRRVKQLIDRHRRNPRFDGFVTKLENALPDLFRFVTDPSIPSTNNAVERALRELVVHRKIRGSIRSVKTMEWLGNLFTCVMTWQQKGLDVLTNAAKYV